MQRTLDWGFEETGCYGRFLSTLEVISGDHQHSFYSLTSDKVRNLTFQHAKNVVGYNTFVSLISSDSNPTLAPVKQQPTTAM